MNKEQIKNCGDELFDALVARRTVAPLTGRFDGLSVEDAYYIAQAMTERRIANGERIIGKKIGVTSKAVQQMLNVHQPDFGYLTDAMAYSQGQEMPISEKLIQPRAEGEIAFILGKDLVGPGVNEQDVIAATDCLMPCFEVVDSRIADWNITIEDTVADNASCGLFLLGDQAVLPGAVDLVTCGMVVEKNGKVISTGAGAAAMGNPARCVAWLANTLGSFGSQLEAGDVILSGSLVPLEPVVAGDSMTVQIGGIGSASIRFT